MVALIDPAGEIVFSLIIVAGAKLIGSLDCLILGPFRLPKVSSLPQCQIKIGDCGNFVVLISGLW